MKNRESKETLGKRGSRILAGILAVSCLLAFGNSETLTAFAQTAEQAAAFGAAGQRQVAGEGIPGREIAWNQILRGETGASDSEGNLDDAKSGLQDSKDNLDGLKAELEQIKANRRSAADRLANLQADKSNLEAYLKELDANLMEVTDTIAQLEEGIAAKELEIQDTKAELAEAKDRAARQYEAMKLRIQYMYETGEIQYLELLLQSESISDFLNRVEYITAIIEYDRDMRTAYQETCEQIEEQEKILEAEYTELAELKAVNEEVEADLQELSAAKRKELERFNSQIAAVSAQVAEYDKEVGDAEAEMSDVEAEIAAQEAMIRRLEEEERRRREEEERRQQEENNANGGSEEPGSGGGSGAGSTGYPGLIWPLSGYSYISSYFGGRDEPVAGVGTYHKGIDIPAPSGTSICAAASGTVITSTYHYSAGNYIVLYHGDGFCTIYMHCSKLLVSVGDQVSQGDTIGLVGTTGYSTGNHLHFGVRIDGSYVNPLNYVSQP